MARSNTQTIEDAFREADRPAETLIDLDLPSLIEYTAGNAKTKVDELRSTHPYYDEHVSKWKFYMDSFEGGEDFANGSNIFKHVRENKADFEDRVKRAVYFNYVQPLVGFFSNFIFSEEITRIGGSHASIYSGFIADADNNGNKMELFMKEVSDLSQIFGHIDILVDKKQLPEDLVNSSAPISKQQEKELGLDKPYCVILYPYEVLDWIIVNGKFTYLKRCVKERGIEFYTEWYADSIVSHEVIVGKNGATTLKHTGTIPNPFKGEVPCVRSYYKQSKKYKNMGISFLKDISYICRYIMNVSSLIGEFLTRQCVVPSTLITYKDFDSDEVKVSPIVDLVGKEFLALTWDNDKRDFTYKRAYDVRKTGNNKFVQQLTYAYKENNELKIGHLSATPDHLILLNTGEYLPMKDLQLRDLLVTVNDKGAVELKCSAVSVEDYGSSDVYNFEVEDTHNYVANGIVIHNCFNMLAKEVDANIPFTDQNEGNQGTSNVLEYSRGANVPQYVSPPVDPAQFLQSEIKNSVLEIYRLASQDTALEAFTGQSRSGDAQQQSFHKVIPFIALRAEGLEQTELKLTKYWLKWINPEAEWDGRIAYKNDYGILNVTNFLIQIKMLFSDIGVPSVTFVKEEMRRMVQEFDGKISQETLKMIFDEIDENVNEDYIANLISSTKSSNNLRGVPGMRQLEQGEVQKTLGNNTLISGVGANKLVGNNKQKISDSSKNDETPNSSMQQE